MELVRFKSTKEDGYVSLSEYCTRMKADQKNIYYITGDNEANLKNSPLLEMYTDKDIEVLIMDQDIDEFVIPSINKYKEHDLKSVNFSDATDDLQTDDDDVDLDLGTTRVFKQPRSIYDFIGLSQENKLFLILPYQMVMVKNYHSIVLLPTYL